MKRGACAVRWVMSVGSAVAMLAIAAPSIAAQGVWRGDHRGEHRGEHGRHGGWRGDHDGRYGRRHRGGVSASLGAFGGADFTVGSTARGMDAGWTAGALLEVRPWRSPLGLRLDGLYQHFTPSGAAALGSFQIWGGDLNFLLTVPGRLPVRPYLTGGVGLYGTKSSIIATGAIAPAATITTSGARFALNGGVGVRAGFGGVGAFVEARYLHIFTPGARTKLVPVTFGLTIGGW